MTETKPGMDRRRQKSKRFWVVLSHIVLLILLCILFLVAINIGSLKVSFIELFRGLFIAYDPDVATIYDLRFPRIIISVLAGAAVAVSGVLCQAVLKNPLADPGIIGISSGAGFAAVCVTSFVPSLYFFTPMIACIGGILAFLLVYALSWKGGVEFPSYHPDWYCGQCFLFRHVQCGKFYVRQ